MPSESACHDLELVQCIQALRTPHPELKLFGLIDGTTENTTLDQFFLLAPAAGYEPLFLATEFSSILPHSPYLIHITEPDESFFRDWGCWAENHVIWWLSPHDLEQQAAHWRSLIQILSPQDDSVIFRFWDHRVLAACLPHCTEQERQQLLAPCHTLFIPQSLRQWTTWTTTSVAPPLTARQAPWWHMRAAIFQGFNTSFEQMRVDAIEDDLWRQEPERLQQIYPPALPTLIQQGIQQANTLGLLGDEALTRFVRCQLQLGSRYWTHPSLTHLWQQPAPRDNAFLAWSHQVLK